MTADGPIYTVAGMLRDLDDRLDKVESWRDELHGAYGLLRFAIGTSLLSAAVSMIALIQQFTGR